MPLPCWSPELLGSGVGGSLPSGGLCAAVSASLPAGTPCLSDRAVAPRWKDRGQGQAASLLRFWGVFSLLVPQGGLEEKVWGEARSQPSSWPPPGTGTYVMWVGVEGCACCLPSVSLPWRVDHMCA